MSDINFWRVLTAAFSEEIKMYPLAVQCLSVHMSTYINSELPKELSWNLVLRILLKFCNIQILVNI